MSATPPRNGEGDRAAQRRGGGVFAASPNAHQLARRERRSGNLPEVLLWRELRKRPDGHKFRRQHSMGAFVLDFACLAARLAVEIDGAAHDFGDRPARDVRRDGWLGERGFTVLRLPAALVLSDLSAAVAARWLRLVMLRPLHHRFAAAPLSLRGGPPSRSGEV